MSDGSISQNEIDALLSGMGGSGSASAGGAFTPARQEALQKFFDGNVPALSANLDSMTGKTVSVSNPVIELSSRETLLQKVPDMAVAVTIDFDGALTGDHLFVLTPEFAEKLVGLVNNEDSVTIDDMALSVISETIAQYVGKEISAFDSRNIKGVTNMPAEAHHVPKAMVRLSQDFALLTYSVTIDNTAFNFDIILQDENVYILEVAARCGATGIPECMGIMYETDYFKCIIENAAGRDVGVLGISDIYAASLLFFSKRGGVLQSIDYPQIGAVSFDYNIGDTIPKFENATNRIGQAIISASSQAEIDYKLRLLENVQIIVAD